MKQDIFIFKKDSNWTKDQIVVFDAENLTDFMINIHFSFISSEPHSNKVTINAGIFPHWPTRLAFPLSVAEGKVLFLPRTPGRFKATVNGNNISFEELDRIEIVFSNPAGAKLKNVHLENYFPDEYTFPSEPLVDELYQWKNKDWEGKAESIEEVSKALHSELKEKPPVYPEFWSKYGGWKKKKFDATGFFRTEHDGKRWWLVDPDGFAFWSIGINCVRTSEHINVEGIEKVFEKELPSIKTHPHLWRTDNLFSGNLHNLERVFGQNWRDKWLEITRRRLINYRFNTIANWSEPEIQTYADIPYVLTMTDFPKTSTMIFRDFPDVYSDEYTENCHKFARQLEDVKNNPYIIGYFMTNEPQWAFIGSFDLGVQLLRDGTKCATMQKFIETLKSKYTDIEKLNSAWETSFSSFDDLSKPIQLERYPKSKPDTMALTSEATEKYVTTVAKACSSVDPNHLNLGLRWAWIHSDYQLAGSDILDAFSINCYQLAPDADLINQLAEKAGKPLLIGEFHIGSLDKGLPSAGIRSALTMDESTKAYQHYIEQAAMLPNLIGIHYFKWGDQNVMGRSDGENMQIGLTDVTYRSYKEWDKITADIHPNLYEIIDGQREGKAPEQKTVTTGTLTA